MAMTAGMRRAALAVHVTTSVGWIGAAVGYLVLAIVGATSEDATTVRAAWIAMSLTGWMAIVPLACLAFVTGLVMALGTRWGLIRHYWVLAAFLLTTLALAVLLAHMPGVSRAAAVARDGNDAAVMALRVDVAHPALGIFVLVVVAVLNMYKPRGVTGHGQPSQALTPDEEATTP